ncbi:hypothetical protein [Spiroplasma endosymbiont of Nebria brevicollis]|uniref:hypothetical protein n=1 Tax=Spiroplasma endosymbiont of Nebria brevicollis TaxID=3066284 RepID=UPI00313C06D6
MSQKLTNTPPLNKWENENLLFNFKFTLISKDLDAIHYKKVFQKIIIFYSSMTIKQFSNNNGMRAYGVLKLTSN